MDVIGLGKLVIDSIKEVHSILQERKSNKKSSLEIGSLLELYGSAVRLNIYAKECEKLFKIDSGEIKTNDLITINKFLWEIFNFLKRLTSLNLSLINIYYPELAEELFKIVYSEAFYLQINKNLPTKYGMTGKEAKRLSDFFDRHDAMFLALRNSGIVPLPRYGKPDGPDRIDCIKEIFFEAGKREHLQDLIATASSCKSLIGKVLRENWDFKELFQHLP